MFVLVPAYLIVNPDTKILMIIISYKSFKEYKKYGTLFGFSLFLTK